MSGFFLYALVIVNVALLAWYYWGTRNLGVWLHPATYFVLNGWLHYPMRALILVFSPEENGFRFYPEDIVEALAYYTAFATILLLITHASLRRWGLRPTEGVVSRTRPSLAAMVVCFGLIVASFGYRSVTGRLYGLYQDISALYSSTGDNLIVSWWQLRWLFLPWALVEFRRTRRLSVGGMFAVVLICSLADSVVSTGKGFLVSLLVFYLAYSDWVRKRPSKAVVAVIIAAALGFSVYSYLARYYGDVRGEFSVSATLQTFSDVSENAERGREMATSGVVSRFSYLDGLVLTMQRSGGIERGAYAFGSFVEFANLLPRFVWPSRPFFSFNHFLTSAVWGYSSFSETPIGRVGESFFVASWAGLVYAGLYGLMFLAMFRILMRRKEICESWRFGLHILVLMMYGLPDAYLLYGVKPLLYLVPWVAFVWFFGRMAGASPSRPRAMWSGRSTCPARVR